MRTRLAKARYVAHNVEKEHLFMASAYGGAGYFGHGSELLLMLAYLAVFVVHLHLVLRRAALRHAERQGTSTGPA
jgi:hypothetical protein